ncbi:ABC transporter substrate-binding protein [Thiobaca trueperi]|uniref:Iron complex transport system substrate-binding protein n=1 Tax=Thiobaca trueperi TaxID=127458 RepID=A0A4V2V1J5_9GAMM|nr:ABC transporter substrate-binding protein [Thiobaca trueperi]TCT21422.1 iron complex transport system substrate-binding protein [Thiobaca trueperi]
MQSVFRSPFPSHRPLLATALILTGIAAQAAELVDMTGRHVQIPDQVDRVFAATPPIVPLVYAIDPGKLVTLSFPFKPEDAAYIRPEVMNLPIVGRYTGEGPPPNPELLARAAPQISIAWDIPFIDARRVEETFRTLGTPGLFVHLARLADYPAALELVGQAIGEEVRATRLASAIRDAMTRVEQAVGAIPDGERKRVYFAEGPDGLLTECADSFHAEVIGLAGGENVMDCKTQAMCGREKMTLDQIKTLDPDVILADDARFLTHIKTDPAWNALRAVREGQVHLGPTKPFNWLGRPPSFMRALAIQWFANRLYPERFPWDADLEIKSFYELFLGVKPEAVDVRDILGQG